MRPFGVRRLFRFPSRKRDDVRDDVREKFAFHIDMRIADLVNAGMSKHDAHARALREFGELARIRAGEGTMSWLNIEEIRRALAGRTLT